MEEYCANLNEFEVSQYVHKIGVCAESSVRIYRSVSLETDQAEIEPGDWVTPEYSYAELHVRDPYTAEHDGRVLHKDVSKSDVRWAGTDVTEWYYVPHELIGAFSTVEAFRNHYNL